MCVSLTSPRGGEIRVIVKERFQLAMRGMAGFFCIYGTAPLP